MNSNDLYDISSRIKNLIAKENIAISSAGTILVNYFTLMIKDLYDFSDTLDQANKTRLCSLLEAKENIPLLVIKASAPPKETSGISYKQKSDFSTNQDALEYYEKEYEELGNQYGISGDDLWADAEESTYSTEDYRKIMKLRRNIDMCKYLIKKYESYRD